MLDALAASAARHSRRSIVLSSYYRGELAELRRISIGTDLVFGRLWRETGCGEVIYALLAGRRFGFDVERTIYLTVLHRLMVSGSDRHASAEKKTRLPGDGLARRGDRRRPHHDGCHRGGSLSPPAGAVRRGVDRLLRHHLAVLEGAGGETLGQLGHSKDYRPHLKQVVLGMVLDGDDRPFASFLWPGDTADGRG